MSDLPVELCAKLESHQGLFHIEAVTLTVHDLDRMTRFYCDVVGLSVVAQSRNRVDLGNDSVVLLTLLEDAAAEAAPAGTPGLFHVAFLLPTREDLGLWLATAMANQWTIEGASDHLVSEALYLSDPEGNGIEIYRDRPRDAWQKFNEGVFLDNRRLDGQGLLDLVKHQPGATFSMPKGARVGHVHLCVNDLALTSDFVKDKHGLTKMFQFPQAVFFGENGYHHHIAINTWRKTGQLPRIAGQLGLTEVKFAVEDEALRHEFHRRWEGAERITDADGITYAL